MSKDDIEKKNESAVQQRLAAIFATNKDEITIPKIYVDMTEDLKAAAVLDELMFWTLPKRNTGKTSLRVYRDGGLWLAVRRSDWWDRKRLSERQSDGAITKLVELDLIEKDVFLFGGKPTVHIRLKMKNFVKMYAEKIQEITQEYDENTAGDIADLYEMMGFPNEMVKSNLPNGEMLNLPNGEIINSLQQPPITSTVPFSSAKEEKKFTQEEMQEIEDSANRTVDGILALNMGRGDKWEGREMFRDNHLHYADWWHEKTNLACKKKNVKSWQKAFSDWRDEELAVPHLLEAYNQDIAWKKAIADPNELTKKAVAIKALAELRPPPPPRGDDDPETDGLILSV